jgi:WD40 repeat protein
VEGQDLSVFLKPKILKPAAEQGGEITRRFAMNKVGRMFAAAFQDRTVRFYAAETGEEMQRVQDDFLCTSLAFSPRGDIVAAGTVEHVIKLWDIRTGELLGELEGHTYPVLCLAFSPDGDRLVSGSGDTTLAIWNIENQSEIHRMKGHGFYVVTCDWDPRGHRIVSGSVDANVCEWEADTGKLIAKHSEHRAAVQQARFSYDGSRLASCSSDQIIVLWDSSYKPMKPASTLREHSGEVRALSFSPDGGYMVTGSSDKDLFLWDAGTERVVGRATTIGEIDGVEWYPDGKAFITADGSGAIIRWEVTDMGSMLAPFEQILKEIEADADPANNPTLLEKYESLVSSYDPEILQSKSVFYVLWQCRRALGLLKGTVRKK